MISFFDAVRESMPKALAGLSLGALSVLDYKEEIQTKENALALFCEKNGLIAPEKIVESPRFRNYRTTTKRRAGFDGGTFRLFFGEDDDRPEFAEALEPEEHLEIYRFVERTLQKPVFRLLAQAMNWVIVRGSYRSRAVIFNIFEMNAAVVRKLKLLGEHLNAENLGVISAHVYFDPTRSDYYLEAIRPTNSLSFKTLYGPRQLSLDLGTFRLKYPVTGFSQINESQIPNLLSVASELLAPKKSESLLDLYCGYGLFSFGLGEKFRSTLGVEWTGDSIECAKASARFLKRGSSRFIAGKIDSRFVAESIPKFDGPEIALLDPPRKGTEPGVILELARRNPERVLHIFCGTDEIPRELNQWRLSHYAVQKIQPLDLFPGSPHLETAVLLERK